MGKKFRRLYVALLWLLAVAAVHAQPTKSALIEDIMVLSGLERQLEELPRIFAATVHNDQQTGPHQAVPQDLRDEFVRAVSYDALRESVLQYLGRHYDEDRFRALVDMLNQPLLKKMTTLETEGSTAEAYQEMAQFAEILKGQATAERLELVKHMDDVVGATELGLEVQAQMIRTFAVALDPLAPPEERLKEGQLEQLLAQVRSQSSAPLREWTQLQMLYIYRDASDAELEAYMAVYDTDLGRWSLDLMVGAIGSLFEEVTERIAFAVANQIENRPGAAN